MARQGNLTRHFVFVFDEAGVLPVPGTVRAIPAIRIVATVGIIASIAGTGTSVVARRTRTNIRTTVMVPIAEAFMPVAIPVAAGSSFTGTIEGNTRAATEVMRAAGTVVISATGIAIAQDKFKIGTYHGRAPVIHIHRSGRSAWDLTAGSDKKKCRDAGQTAKNSFKSHSRRLRFARIIPWFSRSE